MKLPNVGALFSLITSVSMAGPFAPPAGQEGSTAIALNSPEIRYWASEVVSYAPGAAVDGAWMDTSRALGPAGEEVFDVVSLGRGGQITLQFPQGISNGPGWDFVVFENAFDDFFLELAYVGVSSDGVHFSVFPYTSLTPSSVPAFGQVDTTNINNLAGKYRAGYGTPFDLEDFIGYGARLDLANVRYVRLYDVAGDGSALDSELRPVYDPFPTIGSAGFDLDAIGVRYPVAFNANYDYESGWSYAESIGWYVGDSFPWIFSEDQGWWFIMGALSEGIWAWDAALGWLWTKLEVYPSLWSPDRNSWLFYDSTVDGTRFFNQLSDGTWLYVPVSS